MTAKVTPDEVGRKISEARVALGDAHLGDFRLAIDWLVREERWAKPFVDVDGQTQQFSNWKDFCGKVLGVEPAAVTGLMAQFPQTQELCQNLDLASQPDLEERGVFGKGRPNRSDNITSNGRGTDSSYLARRLRRDCPELYERVLDPEDKLTAHAAAIKAGITRPTASIFIDTPEAAIDGLLRRFTFYQLERALAKHG